MGGGYIRQNGGRTSIPTSHTSLPLFLFTSASGAMATDQRASERVGELIHRTFESLLQANTDLERLQDLIGLGMGQTQLLAPHSKTTWKFILPQEKRFRENWEKFIAVVNGGHSNVDLPGPSRATVGAVMSDHAPALVPATSIRAQDTVAPVRPKV